MESDLLVCYHDDIGWSPLHRLCTKACEQEIFHHLVDLYKAKTISQKMPTNNIIRQQYVILQKYKKFYT